MSKENKLIIGSIVAVVIMAIGFTYAYFVANIEGDRKNITINMTDLRIIFNGGDTIEGSNLYSEDNFDVVKTFTIENKTKSEYKYNLVIEDLVNTTVTSGSLVYKITCDDSNGYNMTDFQDLPKALTAIDTTLAYNIPIASKALQTYTIEIKYINKEDVNQSADMGAILSGKLFISKGSYPALSYMMLKDNPTISTRSDFSTTFTENTTGTLFKTDKTDTGSEVHYYAGNTTNNWVKFGKETKLLCTYNNVEVTYVDYNSLTTRSVESESECISTNICDITIGPGKSYYVGVTEEQCGQVEGTWTTNKATYNFLSEKDIYWRIIRTNEDGSVRMLYSGLEPDTTLGEIGLSAFNSTYQDPMYVGYMYGTSGSLESNQTNTNDSTIKKFIDNWYEKNLLTNYDKYISKTAIYCNDRILGTKPYSISSGFTYGVYMRLYNNTPTYICGGTGTEASNDNAGGSAEPMALSLSLNPDMFSASITEIGGNGQLKYPIALMTADEVVFAGGLDVSSSSSSYIWYYTNSQGESITGSTWWWTLSPAAWDTNVASVWHVNGERMGRLNSKNVQNAYAVRPVVSLASCVGIKSGDGTPSYPYVIDESSCS